MWRIADRIVKTIADVTIGTTIVLVHVAFARRGAERVKHGTHRTAIDGTHVWLTQISP